MDGKEIVRIIEAKLFELGISKGKFYKDCGLNSATMSNWRNGIFTPSPAKLHIIEEYLNVTFSDVSKIETTGMDANLAELLDSIRTRPDLGVLLRSASDVPPSSVYRIVAQIEKEKEMNLE